MKTGGVLGMLKTAAQDWVADSAPRLGASVAFYTIFSLSPLLILVVAVASFFLNNADTARDQLISQISTLIGDKGADVIQGMLTRHDSEKQGLLATVMAGVTLLIGSTGVFMELQAALNTVWDVKQQPGAGIWGFIRHRLLSFAMVLTIGFLLLVSLALTAALSAVGKMVGSWIPSLEAVSQVLNFIASFGVIMALFALIFKFMPDVKIPWHDVWIGAAMTSLLFTIGKLGIGLYLAKSTTASAYGAAGSLVILLMWVYYSAQILFFGAELTQVYSKHRGSQIVPKAHAAIDVENSDKEESPVQTAQPRPAVVAPTTPPVRQPRVKPGFVVPGLVLLLALFLPKTRRS